MINQLSLTKDLWRQAQNQVKKLKTPQQFTLRNQVQNNFSSRKSIDQIYKNANKTLSQLMPTGITSIQQAKQQVPNSVKLLDTYAQKMGFLPMGQVYQGPGSRYIGRMQQITQKGQIYYRQFPKFDDNYVDTPDLTQNLTFYANRAITKWNQFVESQAQLAHLLQKAQTQQGRKQMMIQHAKTSSRGSDVLRMLSSLYFLYCDQKSQQKNILRFEKPQQIVKFKQLLRQKDDLWNAWNTVLQYVRSIQHDLSTWQVVKNYHQFKQQSIKSSLRPQQYQTIKGFLESPQANVPQQMISIPMKKSTKWINMINQKGQYASKIITQIWDPSVDWFKPVNYLKI